MAWRDQLRPASFRGVPFHVDGDDLEAGRRVQIHEYPQRDKPYAEDLGRAARRFSVTAYVIGPEYMAARDRLLEAIETAGPGELVHPQYGALQVTVADGCRVAHSDGEGGMARFSLTFVEAGELAFPSAKANTAAVVEQRTDALRLASIDDFAGKFSVAGLPDFVTDGATSDATAIFDFILDALALYRGGSSQLEGMAEQIGALFGQPEAMATRIMDLFAEIGEASRSATEAAADPGFVQVSATTGYGGYTRTMARLTALSRLAAYQPSAPTYSTATPTRRQQAANTTAVASVFRRAALVESARTVAAAEWPVHDDAVRVRDQLAGLIDAEAMQPDVPDPVFRALTDLRVAIVRDITARTAEAARLRTVTPTTVRAAVVLAYDLYEDAGRDGEIIARNGIRHPGFVPIEPLKVLT